MPTLDWIGKKAVVNHHREVPFHLLKEVPELSCGDPDSGNLIVEGDNLLALKALLPYYAGKVKCIYIDPPYNTGNEGWVYNDNVNSPEMRDWLGRTVGKEAEDLSRHDKWLCMMYPRLALLREFLRDDGSIWISMDDSEIGLLRPLMDEIFGRQRFVACNVWQKRYSRENRGSIGDAHEYLLIYASNPDKFKETRNRVPLNEQQAKVYKNPNNDPRGRWRGIPMTAQGWRPNQMYEIETPSGKIVTPPEGRCWSTIESEFEKLRSEGRIYFGKKGDSQPSIIRFLSEVEGLVPWTWWPHDETGHTDEARKDVQSIFGSQTVFDTPKPVRLIERILQIATSPGDTVMDSFAGSGTTGHTVFRMNHGTPEEESRNFILVELDNRIAREVTSERCRKIASGYTDNKEREVPGLGGGFKYVQLSDPVYDESGRINEAVKFPDLARHVFFTETGSPLPANARLDSPLVGSVNGRAVYLLFNGILKDKSADGGNRLTRKVLQELPTFDGAKVVYGTACQLGQELLQRHQVTFKQIPYAIPTN
jgi:adenine-specific DNA-methyltransferase